MKNFAAYFPGVYAWSDTENFAHPWFPRDNGKFWKEYNEIGNFYEWEGVAGQPAKRLKYISYDNLPEFDMKQTESALAYIRRHAHDSKPFFMDVNFMAIHEPIELSAMFKGRSHLGNYSDKMLELDYNVGRIMDLIRAEAPDTIVVLTADNGAWQDAFPMPEPNPFRGEKGRVRRRLARPRRHVGAPGRNPAGAVYHEMMLYMDIWPTAAAMVALTPPPRDWVGNDGKPIYFDGIDNSSYVTGKAPHSARDSWIYIDGESLGAIRKDIAVTDDPSGPRFAWKYTYPSKDTWLGPTQNAAGMGSVYNLTLDPYEKYDMLFNGAVPSRMPTTSPGRWAGLDNGWFIGLADEVLVDFDKTIIKYPSIERIPGGASTDLVPNLQNPKNPVPLMDPTQAGRSLRGAWQGPSTRRERVSSGRPAT